MVVNNASKPGLQGGLCAAVYSQPMEAAMIVKLEFNRYHGAGMAFAVKA
jgi:hypothetical protein